MISGYLSVRATPSHVIAKKYTPLHKPLDNLQSCSSLNEPEARADSLLDLFVLVLQKRERISHLVPLSFGFTARKPRCKLVGKLFGMFVLWKISV